MADDHYRVHFGPRRSCRGSDRDGPQISSPAQNEFPPTVACFFVKLRLDENIGSGVRMSALSLVLLQAAFFTLLSPVSKPAQLRAGICL
jgi:hypothetical protein